MTKYYISSLDETKYVTTDKLGKYTIVTSLSKATYYTNKEKARNVINNNLNGRCSSYKVLEINDNRVPSSKNMVDAIEMQSIIDEEPFLDIALPYDLKEMCERLIKAPLELENEQKRLRSKYSKICKGLTDIAHHLEFNQKLSASYRCKLSILEGKLLKKRREIKDALFYIDKIQEILSGKTITLDDISLEDRKYKPREFECLFEESEIPNFDEWWEE